jgi:hypothetical protein
MAGGELSSVFKGLANDAAQAGGDIAKSVARMTEQTASIEEANVARTLETEAGNVKALNDIADNGTGNAVGHASPTTTEQSANQPSTQPGTGSSEPANNRPVGEEWTGWGDDLPSSGPELEKLVGHLPELRQGTSEKYWVCETRPTQCARRDTHQSRSPGNCKNNDVS